MYQKLIKYKIYTLYLLIHLPKISERVLFPWLCWGFKNISGKYDWDYKEPIWKWKAKSKQNLGQQVHLRYFKQSINNFIIKKVNSRTEFSFF